jgi:hypothetical protein
MMRMTKSALTIAGALIALTLGSGAAWAQTHGTQEDIAPTSMGNDIAPPSPKKGNYLAALDYAGCVANASGDDARGVFMTQAGSRESSAAITALAAASKCGKLPGSAASLRGALAERVYLKTWPAAPAVPTTPLPFTGSGKPELAMYDITRCVVTRDPLGADMLIRSAPRSDAEKDALHRVVPVIGTCTPAGGQVGFGREEMRGMIAEGLIAVRGAAQ